MFINVPSEQPDAPLQKQNITQTQRTYETYTYNPKDRKLNSLTSIPQKIKLIIKTGRV